VQQVIETKRRITGGQRDLSDIRMEKFRTLIPLERQNVFLKNFKPKPIKKEAA